jgi:zinc transport system ATP-binding protein
VHGLPARVSHMTELSAEAGRQRRELAPMRGALLRGSGLSLKRGARSVLEGVDIEICTGEIVTLIGPNGAGKTTLVRVLLGLVRPDVGSVWRKDGLRIGYVPQRFDTDRAVPLTVSRFLRLGTHADASAIGRALAEVGTEDLEQQQLFDLSGGEFQRVVLARALLREPELLVLDEPVRGVDHAGEAELYTLIARLRDKRQLGVLLVSHDLHVVMARSDRVLCINRHVCCSGVPQVVARNPEYVRLFGPEAAQAVGIYHHHHDHTHDLDGAPMGPASSAHQDG